MEKKKMSLKHYIGILCAVTLVVGAIAGVSVSAADNADISEITKTVNMERIAEGMEAKGFDVTVEGDMIYAYKEGYGKTVQVTVDCPDGECQFQKPELPEGKGKCGLVKKRFRFRMHGGMDPETLKAKMLEMGYNLEDIEAKMEGMTQKRLEDCPLRPKPIE